MRLPIRNFKRFFNKALAQPEYAITTAFKRLKVMRAYKNDEGIAPDPESITFFLTHRCNLHCKMCGQWGEHGAFKNIPREVLLSDMKFSDYNRLIAELAAFKPNITLFGGEPLVYQNCMMILNEVKRNGMHCLMITNGSLLTQFATDIVNYGLDELNVSIDGSAQLHDEIRGMPGLFNSICDGLKAVNRAKILAKKTKPIISIQCTISEYNYKHLFDLGSVAQDCSAKSITFHNLIFLSPEIYKKQQRLDERIYNKSNAWEGFIGSPKIETGDIINQIALAKKKFPKIDIDIFPNLSPHELEEYYNNPAYTPKEYPNRCLSPWLTAYIFPDGTVRPCLNSSYSFGNILTTKFNKIWNSKEAVNFRRTLKHNGSFPACVRCTELYRY